jgi:hypothetical protein
MISELRRSQLYPSHGARSYIRVTFKSPFAAISWSRCSGGLRAAISESMARCSQLYPGRVSVLAAISESRCRSLRLASISESQCSHWQLNPSPGPPRRSSDDSLPGMALAAVMIRQSRSRIMACFGSQNHGMLRIESWHASDRSRAIRVTVLAAAFRVMVLAAVPASHCHMIMMAAASPSHGYGVQVRS